MAKELDEFPETRGRAVGDSKYPWDLWLNGKVWQLDNGDDFIATKTTNFRQAVIKAAKAKGLKAKVAVVNDGKSLVVQAISMPSEETKSE